MALRYCFEEGKVRKTLDRSKKNDLAVIDSDGIPASVIKKAKDRGVLIYDYLNVGALEMERSYFKQFKHLLIAPYDGWTGEYWIDVTDKAWQKHLFEEAEKKKKAGAIGLYIDNVDIFWMCSEGFKGTKKLRPVPDEHAVFEALVTILREIRYKLGLVVMPNGGDDFVRAVFSCCADAKSIIQTVNQEGVLYQDNQKQSREDTKYFTKYLDWCVSKGLYVRGIEYTKSKTAALKCKAYYAAHGWKGLYISKHKNLEGD